MAQLPPKIPTITPNWADFSHQKMEGLSINHHHHNNNNNPMWIDEFLDFSSARRGSHRRSMSDSIAFLEAPTAEECLRANSSAVGKDGGFEGLDDDQLMSMFNDDVAAPGASNPSSPSDHNSINDDGPGGPSSAVHPKSEPQENDDGPYASAGTDNSGERINDPKRIKRILANRQSAQRSRVRKLHYISELERSVSSLQAEVSVLSPRVAYLDHQRLVLNVDNSVLKQRIAALAQDKVFKDAHQEALKREIERLRQIYYEQNMKKMENDSPSRIADTSEQEQLAVN
ncbi:basic leucine zipper 61-like [Salvia hispanica]|uniref:basic leucine zipper 61-like n=1 Tax=Salvia hispanica TaxID=49212 RepID=UPI002009A9AC|nr:basic leucine zipper 61-like [Salvia hispanica]